MDQRMDGACRALKLGAQLVNQHVYSVRLLMEALVAEFIADEQHQDAEHGQTKRESRNIEDRITFFTGQATDGYEDVVLEHARLQILSARTGHQLIGHSFVFEKLLAHDATVE